MDALRKHTVPHNTRTTCDLFNLKHYTELTERCSQKTFRTIVHLYSCSLGSRFNRWAVENKKKKEKRESKLLHLSERETPSEYTTIFTFNYGLYCFVIKKVSNQIKVVETPTLYQFHYILVFVVANISNINSNKSLDKHNFLSLRNNNNIHKDW